MDFDINFFKGKRVFLTGHTGFKGTWMSVVLVNAGAEVTGYSSCSKKEERLFDICGIKNQVFHVKGDIRDYSHLYETMNSCQPDIVIHMAAQPIVRDGYVDPLNTYSTNVMGTVNVCECVRQINSVKSFLNVTTDKVYENKEWEWGYRENESLDGFDPYSNSKSCSELVTHCYKNSYFLSRDIGVSTARAGNVIGGGDFARNRIIPDCVRAAVRNEDIVVRNPFSTRPYQHVLEPIFAYLLIVSKQYQDKNFAGYYNVGPDESDCYQTCKLVDIFVNKYGNNIKWISKYDDGPHEANFLKLDCSKIKSTFGWKPRWGLDIAVEKVVEWTKCWINGNDIRACMNNQILDFLGTEF